ncbi:hypothetical protein Agub_g12923 [Astrephomene gubernaculifera]|uniref:Peptidyl-prolyl cis-trans isomerase CYP38-like PsbQ-like domain-containing protein n=1 Tax=Astrephomene gubernaculifera TaxID=47775 RepID=A0AAD3E3G4_9CHLO|nr:hypothetical protein Agub_g12923 [Astrephomene gubernaculifera]
MATMPKINVPRASCKRAFKPHGRKPALPSCFNRIVTSRSAPGEDSPSAAGAALRFVQALAASAILLGANSNPALAVLNSPNAQIARSVDSALRRSIPAFNTDVKEIQQSLEDVQYLLRIPQRKPWGSMAASVTSALSQATQQPAALLAGVPPASLPAAQAQLDALTTSLQKLDLAIRTQQSDAVSLRVAEALEAVSELELLQAPGLPYVIPKEYRSLPRLVGRAVVEMTVAKRDGSPAFTDGEAGGQVARAKVTLTVDGYSAPVSAGNFVRNVMDGLYDNRPLQVNYTSVFVTAPAAQQRPPIPLEILPAGEFEPLYRLPLDVRSGELPVLPLSISGAVSFAHLPSGDPSYLSGSDWFVYKFDKQQAGLAGLAFDEGSFGVFGYVTEGMDDLVQLGPGDVILSARVVSGAEKLLLPSGS